MFFSGALAQAAVKHVVLISFDGLRSDAISTLDQKSLPHFYQLLKEGTSTLNARTDADYTVTLPNHAGMLTGRPVLGDNGHRTTVNHNSEKTIHEFCGAYVSSIFDVLRAQGLTSAMTASKGKFHIFARSYPIDTVFISDGDDAQTVAAALAELNKADPPAFLFVHLGGLDAAGHQRGWILTPGSFYMTKLMEMDAYLGRILEALTKLNAKNEPSVLVVTSDHGGMGRHHFNAKNRFNFTIPFFAWGAGIAAGQDLYALNKTTRRSPGRRQVAYSAALQPIRNGEAANLALRLLGLGCVPQSSLGCAPPLEVHFLDSKGVTAF